MAPPAAVASSMISSMPRPAISARTPTCFLQTEDVRVEARTRLEVGDDQLGEPEMLSAHDIPLGCGTWRPGR